MTSPRIARSPREILNAYLTLFGHEHGAQVKILQRLDAAGIKAAYRAQALRHHPDRARALGLPPKAMAERFVTIRAAYDVLQVYIAQRLRPPVPARPAEFSHVSRRQAAECPPRGNRPPLGQLLFTRGIISFSELVEAIAWQRRGRPSYGEIARAMGLLGEGDLDRIRAARLPKERTGDCAVRIGLVSSLTSRMILRRQAELQRPMGDFFVERGIITRAEIDEMVCNHAPGTTGMNGPGDPRKKS